MNGKLAAFHQSARSLALLGLVIATVLAVGFAGVALLRGTIDSAGFLAVVTGLFGLVGGALGLHQAREGGRGSDSPPPSVPSPPSS